MDELNGKTQDWIENDANSQHHTGIQRVPLDRFNLDPGRIQFLTEDEYTGEVFFIEETRKISKTNARLTEANETALSFTLTANAGEKQTYLTFTTTRIRENSGDNR